jgi:branched-chain amino acid aminotransferase
VVLTPPSEAGLLEGITRAFLFEVGQDVGLSVRDQVLYPADLETADEAFITSTTREMSPVTKIDGKSIGTGKVGPITRRLLEGYRQRAQELTRPAAAKY